MESQRPSYYAWSGYSFEALCFKHYKQIIKKLGLRGIKNITGWRYIPKNNDEVGAQIDLVIDRLDDAITLCEIKYTKELFVIDKSYSKNLENKTIVFQNQTKTTKQIFWCLITPFGIQHNTYSKKFIHQIITLDDFFS